MMTRKATFIGKFLRDTSNELPLLTPRTTHQPRITHHPVPRTNSITK
ncbi:hypothetical protein [Bartonella queenslandensis]|nr:hypothetical protein [Bartonella queenslandensis]